MTGSEWTCARCGVTATVMPGAAKLFEPPASWEQLNGVSYCLGCRRTLAGEAKAAAVSDQHSAAERLRANAEGRIEFELRRTPDLTDGAIAKACRTSAATVAAARKRLKMPPGLPTGRG